MLSGLIKFFQFPSASSGGERAKLLWLIKLRWLATSLFFTLTVIGLGVGYITRYNISKCLGVIGILLVFNVISGFYWADRRKSLHPLVVGFQMTFDLVVLIAFLYITGGFSNPLVSLFLLNAALGGLLISDRYAWTFVFLIHMGLLFLQTDVLFKAGEESYLPLLATTLIFHLMTFSSWFVMRSLGKYLEDQQVLQINSRVFAEKQDRLRAIGALAAGFSHEFASPLNAARLRVSRALRSSPTEDLEEALAAIDACEDVIHQMNSSQLDARDHHFKPTLLKDFATSVIESWQESHPEARLDIQLEDVGESAIPPVNFAQVILNLLDNAFEASKDTPISVQLYQKSSPREENKTVFRVEDGGPGFQADILQRLGEPFVTNKPQGTGLGIYVSQLFAQSLGGDVFLSNKASGGASVSLEWPFSVEQGL